MSRRVLIADDDPTVGLLAAAALRSSELTPLIVETGEAALAAVSCETFALAVLDVEMPGASGFEVCAAIRHRYGNVFPVVLMTGRQDAEFLQELARLNAVHLPKPVDWMGLSGFLSAVLEAAETGRPFPGV